MARFISALTVALGLALASGAAKKDAATPGTSPVTGRLDQELVKRLYSEGDFDPAIGVLEDFQRSHSQFTREESLMVYKYLGVMYSADQATREKGKSYFYKLLKVDPDAKILDMYVSIVVQDIFKSTLDELVGQKGPASPHASTASAAPAAAADAPPPKQAKSDAKLESDNHALYWWLGGLGLAAGIAGGYYVYTASSSSPTHKETDIPITP